VLTTSPQVPSFPPWFAALPAGQGQIQREGRGGSRPPYPRNSMERRREEGEEEERREKRRKERIEVG
jgi:hypothetical protein